MGEGEGTSGSRVNDGMWQGVREGQGPVQSEGVEEIAWGRVGQTVE